MLKMSFQMQKKSQARIKFSLFFVMVIILLIGWFVVFRKVGIVPKLSK